MSEPHQPSLDAQALRRLTESGRDLLRGLWARRAEKALLDPPAQRLLELLEAHPQHRASWEGAEPHDGELNPFLHVSYHALIDKQLRANDPPEAQATLERLIAGGVGRHEAEHRLMEALIRELAALAAPPSVFDQQRYRQRLMALKP